MNTMMILIIVMYIHMNMIQCALTNTRLLNHKDKNEKKSSILTKISKCKLTHTIME